MYNLLELPSIIELCDKRIKEGDKNYGTPLLDKNEDMMWMTAEELSDGENYMVAKLHQLMRDEDETSDYFMKMADQIREIRHHIYCAYNTLMAMKRMEIKEKI